MANQTLASAHAAFLNAGLATDIPWANYSKARQRLARQKGQFAAEQHMIDASAALGRAQARLAEKESDLRSAAIREARRERVLPHLIQTRVNEILTALT